MEETPPFESWGPGTGGIAPVVGTSKPLPIIVRHCVCRLHPDRSAPRPSSRHFPKFLSNRSLAVPRIRVTPQENRRYDAATNWHNRMKIKKKTPKSAQAGTPLYVIGYAGTPPAPQELQFWFDREYGGPLALMPERQGQGEGHSRYRAVHGPWQAQCTLHCGDAEAQRWQTSLEWRHTQAATITPSKAAVPRDICDLVLLSARLARGLVLLTGGTSFDLKTQTFLNPSDWTDRRLELFVVSEHVEIRHDDTADGARDWFFTQGLSKFGLEEIEVFRPRGLSPQPVFDRLTDIADELTRLGRVPTVGSSVSFPLLGLAIRAVRHRTATYAGAPLILREIVWE